LYEAFVWARRALNSQIRRFPAPGSLVEENFHDQNVTGGCAVAANRHTCPMNLTVRANPLVPPGGAWPAAALAVERLAGIRLKNS
jgi:hypothetical protein